MSHMQPSMSENSTDANIDALYCTYRGNELMYEAYVKFKSHDYHRHRRPAG